MSIFEGQGSFRPTSFRRQFRLPSPTGEFIVRASALSPTVCCILDACHSREAQLTRSSLFRLQVVAISAATQSFVVDFIDPEEETHSPTAVLFGENPKTSSRRDKFSAIFSPAVVNPDPRVSRNPRPTVPSTQPGGFGQLISQLLPFGRRTQVVDRESHSPRDDGPPLLQNSGGADSGLNSHILALHALRDPSCIVTISNDCVLRLW